MSQENEEQLLPSSPTTNKHAAQEHLKISYTRDFLLSFSGLDICKNLPSGLDPSILSDLEDTSSGAFDRPRTLAGSLFQSQKRGDYGLPPPIRSEGLSSYARGSGGRWETRSSGSSDRDGDLQSDRESLPPDSGRRFGSQTRRPWQNAEQDGLLGSGAFPRSAGYAGASAPKARGNGPYQLNRSSEPYQPPRPYKAVPYSRKEVTDSFNDETFGSAECTSEDRAEEERKRRASFELMRKEQQKSLQEKQKPIPDNHTEKLGTDIIALLGSSQDGESIRNKSNKLDDSLGPSLSQNDPSRSSCLTQPAASRPLVPPGFASALTEKNMCMQSSRTPIVTEAGTTFTGSDLSLSSLNNNHESRNNSDVSMYISMKNDGTKKTSVQSIDANEKAKISSSGVEGPKHPVDLPDPNDVWEEVVNDLSKEKEARSEDIHAINHSHSTSILEKLFGSALSKDYSSLSNFSENQIVKTEEEACSPVLSESSKFARWFFEEEKKPVVDSPSRDLLSLITSHDKSGLESIVSSSKTIEHLPPMLPSENKDPIAELLPLSVNSSLVGAPEQCYGVLTCEDLELSILAEVKESSSTLQHSVQGLNGKLQEPKAAVDDHASQHLLSLLQKGKKEPASSPLPSSEKTLTLEALFGASFMSELHSVEAPLSSKTDHVQEAEAHVIAEPWMRCGDRPIDSSALGDVNIEEGRAVIQLPEEDSLIMAGDPLATIASGSLPFENANKEDLILSAMLREGVRLNTQGIEGPPHLRGPQDTVDSQNLFNRLLGRPPPQLFPHQMNQARPMFPHLDHLANMNPHVHPHDAHHPFPMDVNPQHAFNMAGGSRFDPAGHRLVHQQQHMPFPPNFSQHHHPIQGLPRGVPFTHPINHMPGYNIPEINSVHSFPMHNRQPNFGGPGISMPGVGGPHPHPHPHPEILERLFEMEMRANSKQIHPGRIPGMYGPELDMNFRYR